MGAIGLPGDVSSQSRFIRAAFVKLNSRSGESEQESVNQFFHILMLSAIIQCSWAGGKESRKEMFQIFILESACFASLTVAQRLNSHGISSNVAITVEAVKEGLHIYDNPVGILTNNPPFDIQMFSLNNFPINGIADKV